jgi:hypothetical protein
MPVVLLALALLQLTAAACDSSGASGRTPLDLPAEAGALAPAPAQLADTDGDGLCDVTEEQLGTDVNKVDTDADGVPDVVEVIAGYDPSDATSPSIDRIARLTGLPGQVLDFEVRATFNGVGQGATGQFSALSSLHPRGLRADHFFVSGHALSAEPPDNVRGIQPGEEHFTSVLGNTRLVFSLHFAYRGDVPPTCTAALPFDYSIKSDSGVYVGSRTYLLIVSSDARPRAEDFCRPVACL